MILMICYLVRSHDNFCFLDFGGSRMIDSQDYDRTVKIAANMTALVQKMVTIFLHDAFTKL